MKGEEGYLIQQSKLWLLQYNTAVKICFGQKKEGKGDFPSIGTTEKGNSLTPWVTPSKFMPEIMF